MEAADIAKDLEMCLQSLALSPIPALRWARNGRDNALRDANAWAAIINSFIPACSLPDELIILIFSILVRLSPIQRNSRADKEPCWLAVTYVCRRWRGVALSAPSLWSIVDLRLSKTRWFEQIFKRCGKEHSLSLLTDSSDNPKASFDIEPASLRYIASRTVEVFLTLGFWQWAKLRFFDVCAAPQLRKLSVGTVAWRKGQRYEPTLYIWHRPEGVALPFPLLEDLKITRLNVQPSDLTSGAHLRHLDLYEQHSERSMDSPPLRSFLDFLRITRRLVTLKVYNSGPHTLAHKGFETEDPKFLSERVHLPLLEFLNLSGTTASHFILPHLYVPACMDASIEILRNVKPRDKSYQPSFSLPLMNILSYLTSGNAFWESWEDKNYTKSSMSLEARSHSRVFEVTYTFERSGKLVGPQGLDQPIRRLCLRFGPAPGTPSSTSIEEALKEITKSLLPASLVNLSRFSVLGFQRALFRESWVAILPLMPNISELSLLKRTKASAALVLLGEGDSVADLVCPTLEILTISHADRGDLERIQALTQRRKTLVRPLKVDVGRWTGLHLPPSSSE